VRKEVVSPNEMRIIRLKVVANVWMVENIVGDAISMSKCQI